MKNLTVSSSPHIGEKNGSTRSIMLDVLVALAPVLLMSVFYFGYHVLINAAVCMGSCFAFELLYSLVRAKDFSREAVRKSSCMDCSCLVTGLILALNLPRVTVVDKWDFNVYRSVSDTEGVRAVDNVLFGGDTVIICILASLVAIVLVKMLFGGIGKNFANPAATARIFVFLAFSSMTFTHTVGIGDWLPASTGATWLSGDKLTDTPKLFFNMFVGNRGASAVGETCIAAIIVSYIYLSVRKVIDYRIPLMTVGSAAVFALLFDGLPNHLKGEALFANVGAHVLSGGLIFGSVFMATDYSTSPNTFAGNAIFCVGISLFTMMIRVFGGYPEGMSFALLIMNCTVPLIDKFVLPRPFGYVRESKKKSAEKSVEKGGARA